MAITYLPITITHPTDRTKRKKLDFLVDSGAVYSVAPGGLLKELGIRKEEEREFTLANGDRIKRNLGIARFEYNKHTGGALVIFGKRGDSVLLGATTLEALGMALDPLKRTLMPLPMVLG